MSVENMKLYVYGLCPHTHTHTHTRTQHKQRKVV